MLGKGPAGRGAASLMLAGSKTLISSRELEFTMATKTVCYFSCLGSNACQDPRCEQHGRPSVGRGSPVARASTAGGWHPRALTEGPDWSPLRQEHLPALPKAPGSLGHLLPGVCVRGSCHGHTRILAEEPTASPPGASAPSVPTGAPWKRRTISQSCYETSSALRPLPGCQGPCWSGTGHLPEGSVTTAC